MKLKHFGLFLLISTVAIFSACSDDDDKSSDVDLALEAQGNYKGLLNVTMAGNELSDATRFISLTRTAENEVKLELKNFSIPTLLPSADIALSGIELEGSGEKVTLKENTQEITIAELGDMEVSIKTNGTIEGEKITLDLEIADLVVVITFDGEFTEEEIIPTTSVVYDMEEWVAVNPNALEKNKHYRPGIEWASANNGIATLVSMGRLDKFGVTESSDSHTGKSAAKLETLDTNGATMLGMVIPKITAGSLYTGSFKLNPSETLNSTQFGMPFDQNPISISLYYKYTPGEVYYRCPDPKKGNIAEVEKGTVDKCSVNAVLYDVTEDESYITGLNTYDDERIVALAQFESSEIVKEYKNISLPFEFKEKYDPSKTYRLAIILSSSADGNTFSGAPGSTLYIDDIEITCEK